MYVCAFQISISLYLQTLAISTYIHVRARTHPSRCRSIHVAHLSWVYLCICIVHHLPPNPTDILWCGYFAEADDLRLLWQPYQKFVGSQAHGHAKAIAVNFQSLKVSPRAVFVSGGSCLKTSPALCRAELQSCQPGHSSFIVLCKRFGPLPGGHAPWWSHQSHPRAYEQPNPTSVHVTIQQIWRSTNHI